MQKKIKKAILISSIPIFPLITFVACSTVIEPINQKPDLNKPIERFNGFEMGTLSLKNEVMPKKIYVISNENNEKIEITSSIEAIAYDKVGSIGNQLGGIRYFKQAEFEHLYDLFSDKEELTKTNQNNWYLNSTIETSEVEKLNKTAQNRYQNAKQNATNYPDYAGYASFLILSKLEPKLQELALEKRVEIKTLVNKKNKKTFYLLDIQNAIWWTGFLEGEDIRTQIVSTVLPSQSQPLAINLISKTSSTADPINLTNFWYGLIFNKEATDVNIVEPILAILKRAGENYPTSTQNLYTHDYNGIKNHPQDLIISEVDAVTLTTLKSQIKISGNRSFAILLKANVPIINGLVLKELTVNGTTYKLYETTNKAYETQFTIQK